MSEQHTNIEAALAALAPNVIAHLDLYRVGKENESTVLPQALWTSPEELRALALVIEVAQALVKGFQFIATSKFGWAKNTHPYSAILECKNQTPHGKKTGRIDLYIAHPDTKVFGLGEWEYPAGFEPRKLQVTLKVGFGGRRDA